MKADRRRELKANSLSAMLQQLPELAKKYQSQIALVLIVAALAVALVRYRYSAAQSRLANAQQGLAVASQSLQRLEEFYHPDPQVLAKGRESYFDDGLQEADQVLQNAPDSQTGLKAQALLVKGDFNFDMANLPLPPGAATQPSLQPAESIDSLLSAAADAYTQVVQNYPSEKSAVTAAHFGLAAVAEDRKAWDDAKKEYQAILNGDADAPYKALAQQRLQMLSQIQRPLTTNLPANPPTSVSATTQPTTRPGK